MSRCRWIFLERMSIKRLSRLWIDCTIVLLAFYSGACQAAVPSAASVSATPHQPEDTTPTSPPATPAAAQVLLDRVFELAVGQEVTLADTDLHLRFERILEESRCPRQVACVWSGQARLLVSVWDQGAPPTTKEFSTFSNPPASTDTHIFEGFSIRLVGVDPYPDSPGTPIPASAYRITLLITRVP